MILEKPNLKMALKINKTVFLYNGHEYRLTGFVYLYFFEDGSTEFAFCNEDEANAVSGYGIAGCIVLLSDVQFLDRISSYPDKPSTHLNNLIEKDKYKLKFLKSLQEGISKKEYEEIIINNLLNDF